MADNAADRKSIRAAEKRARQAAVARAEVIRNVMSTTQGRHWLWDILTDCHIFAPTFNMNPLVTAHSEGERNVGLKLLSDILSNCPDLYLLAQQEANVRHTLDDRRNTTSERRSGPEPDGGDSGREGYPGTEGNGDYNPLDEYPDIDFNRDDRDEAVH